MSTDWKKLKEAYIKRVERPDIAQTVAGEYLDQLQIRLENATEYDGHSILSRFVDRTNEGKPLDKRELAEAISVITKALEPHFGISIRTSKEGVTLEVYLR